MSDLFSAPLLPEDFQDTVEPFPLPSELPTVILGNRRPKIFIHSEPIVTTSEFISPPKIFSGERRTNDLSRYRT